MGPLQKGRRIHASVVGICGQAQTYGGQAVHGRFPAKYRAGQLPPAADWLRVEQRLGQPAVRIAAKRWL